MTIMSTRHDTTTSAIVSIIDESGRPLGVYDDGAGPLWVYRESRGIVGIIRAQTRKDAYEIVEDEFIAEADESTWEDIAKECGCVDPETLMDNAIFQESHGVRPNGPNTRDKHKHGVYQRDLNGEALDRLTPALLESLRLKIAPA